MNDSSTNKESRREAAITATRNIGDLLGALGYTISNDGKISRNQYRDLDVAQVALDINTHLLKDDKMPFYDIPTITQVINRIIADIVKQNNDKLYNDLKHNPSVTISNDDLKKFLSLYFQWDNEVDYGYYKASFLHWLLSVKRRFYNQPESNPLCLVVCGGSADGKSRFLYDITGLMENASLDVKHFDELFSDNRGFKVWTNRFMVAIHEMGQIPDKHKETFKDFIDARYGSGRGMQKNDFSKIEIVTSLIAATNNPPKDVMEYDKDNRKIIFIPFIKLNPSNRDVINDQRDAFRRDKFLLNLFLSINENGKDCFDDDKWYGDFKMWLRPRNAEHSIAEKYVDCLLADYAGKKITAQSFYDAFKEFHSSVAKSNDDGKKVSPMNKVKFVETFKGYFETKKTRNGRYYIVPTIEQAYNKGYSYVNPEDHLTDDIKDLLKAHVEVIDDCDIIKDEMFGGAE